METIQLTKYLHAHADEYDLHGMSIDIIVELIGEETWHKDNLEDLQYYIDKAYFEMEALDREYDEEFAEYMALCEE